jgi:hypothetical protein
MSRHIWRSIAAAPAQADRALDPARDYRNPDRLGRYERLRRSDKKSVDDLGP